MNSVRYALLYLILTCQCISFGQIVDGNGYLIGMQMEVAIDGDGGHEGTADWPGHHSRGGADEVPYGFVASSAAWVEFDGEFLTAGTPENGFGIEINGVNYSNNAWNAETSSYYLQQIPKVPGTNLIYSIDGICQSLEWQGKVAGVRIDVKYTMQSVPRTHYTTEITLTNETGSTLNDVYYYRNLDPDNNHSLTGAFETTNKIVAQSNEDCPKAYVTATQASPRASLIGLIGIGENFRVSHGGYSNRSGSDIWNATGGLEGTVDAINTADEAISLAYKTNLGPGESVNFTYAFVYKNIDSETHLAGDFVMNYDTGDEAGSGSLDGCMGVTVNTCVGDTLLAYIEGTYIDYFDWVWSPSGDENDSTINILTADDGIISVVGTPNSDCFDNGFLFELYVNFIYGPEIVFNMPDPICGEYDLTLFEYWDLDDGENTDCTFLTEEPTNATQTEPQFIGPMMDITDEIWLMCGDSITGCYDFLKIEFNFVGPDA